MSEGDEWELAGFPERLELWIKQESPPAHMRRAVAAWIYTLYDDPWYRGQAERQPGHPNFWHAEISEAQDGQGNVATCSYWIDKANGKVICDLFGTLPATRPDDRWT